MFAQPAHTQNNHYYYPSMQDLKQQRFRMMSDSLSTKANTPECSELDEKEIRSECFGFQAGSSFYLSLDGFDSPKFEIDVKPKKKTFHTPEEKQRFVQDYSRKLKTEMCKNWDTTGTCKFGDRCSFAHGGNELKGKMHLHSNYKTKPCKKYFLKGYCSYGHRCQYLHRELLRRPEFREFVAKVYADKNLYLPAIIEQLSEEDIWLNRFRELRDRFRQKDWFIDDILSLGQKESRRLPVFEIIAPKDTTPFVQNSAPASASISSVFTDEHEFFLFERNDYN